MNILLRKDAVKAGLKRYFNGVPCPRGHIAERLVKGGCLVCDREDSLARNRKNAEKLAEYAKQYRVDHREELLPKWREDSAKRRAANPEKYRELKSASQKRNRASATARNKKWEDANRDQVRARIAVWQKANPEKCAAKDARRRAAELRQLPAWADHAAIGLIYRVAQLAKVTWPDVEIHVDHIVPLQGKTVSGLHVHCNLQILPGTENRSKSNHF